MKQIPLQKNNLPISDDEDYERINQLNGVFIIINTQMDFMLWEQNILIKNIKQFGCMCNYELFNKNQIDHINHNGLNNCKSNLRICNNQENNMNRKSNKIQLLNIKVFIITNMQKNGKFK